MYGLSLIHILRSQGYDNGANMRGKINGVKSRILEKNKCALFSPCGAHSCLLYTSGENRMFFNFTNLVFRFKYTKHSAN